MADEWAERAGDEIQLASWEECIRLLLSSGGGHTLYRGHSVYEWQLESTIERALLEYSGKWRERAHGVMQSNVADAETERWIGQVERGLTEFFQRNAERLGATELPEREDKLGWWEIMQHLARPPD